MPNGTTSNPNDYKVVTFTNKTDFAFTPELGCMYDSRPIFGKSGASIEIGESVVLPYHVGNLLARNLAKAAMNRNAGTDAAGIPTGVPLWNETSLLERQASYITEMYVEDKPTAMTETDRLMAKVEEYKAMVEKLIPEVAKQADSGENTPSDSGNVPPEPPTGDPNPASTPAEYKDKADVITELQKRNIPFDARKSKADLEKLLVN